MKSYLNRNEKTQALTLASFIAYTTERALRSVRKGYRNVLRM